MEQDVIEAVYLKNFDALRKSVSNGVDINGRDGDGRTPLMHAVLSEDTDLDMVAFLLRNGADVTVCDLEQKWTPLHFAARDQNPGIVTILLEHGAKVDAEDIFGNTPLWRCVMSSKPNLEVVKILLANGSDPNKKNKHGVSAKDTAQNMANKVLLEILESGGQGRG